MDTNPDILTYIDTIGLLYFQDKKVLMIKEQGSDVWFIPAFKKLTKKGNKGLLVTQAKKRLNLKLDFENCKLYGVFEAQAHGKDPGTIMLMSCYLVEGSGTPKAKGSITEVAYLGFKDKAEISAIDRLVFEEIHRRNLLD